MRLQLPPVTSNTFPSPGTGLCRAWGWLGKGPGWRKCGGGTAVPTQGKQTAIRGRWKDAGSLWKDKCTVSHMQQAKPSKQARHSVTHTA